MRKALAGLGLLVAALLLDPRPVTSAPRFSRAEWIEARKILNRFDGGILPGWTAEPLPPRRAVADSSVRDSAGAGVVNVRVSPDVVSTAGSAAQPETQAEPHLAIDPANERRLLAGYQEGRFTNGGARALSYALSTNGGKRWTAGLIPNLTQYTGGPWQRASDPWVAFGPDHRAYYVSLAFNETSPDNGIVVSTSTDGGRTWGDPVTVHLAGNDFDDKEAIAVDTYRDSPFRGRVYVAWDMVRDTGGMQPLLVSWSANGGTSFAPAVNVSEAVNIGALPVVGPGGVVHLVWATFPGGNTIRLVTARSFDGGATWTAPQRIDEIFPNGVADMRTGEILPAAAVDPRNGNLYVVWADSRFTGNVDQILISRSTDGGESWSEAAIVSDGPSNAASFTPAVAVDGNGRVGVVYYTQRHDPNRALGIDLYLALSGNGGRTFAKSRRISSTTFDATFAAFAQGKFLGDYIGLVAGKKLFHPLFVTTYGTSALDPGRLQPDVFTASVR